jgi:hypothetical protein
MTFERKKNAHLSRHLQPTLKKDSISWAGCQNNSISPSKNLESFDKKSADKI